MREPGIHIRIECHLGLLPAVGFHTPDLHTSRPDTVEPDVPAVGAVLRSVVQARGVRQTGLLAAFQGYGPDVLLHLGTAESTVGGRLPIRADTVQIAWTQRCYPARLAALEGDHIYIGIVAPLVGRIVAAQADPLSVGGDHMVVVALDDVSRIDRKEVSGTVWGDFPQFSIFIHHQPFSIRSPIGRFDDVGKLFHNLVRPGRDVVDFQVAMGRIGMLCKSHIADE